MPYNLEKVTSPKRYIYRQLYNYYVYCEQTRRMTATTMLSKVSTLNGFVLTSRLSDLRKISNQIITNWVNVQVKRGNSGRSINTRLAHLKSLLHWQSEMGLKMPKL